MKRTAEKVLSVISLVLTVLALIPSFLLVAFGKAITDGTFRDELEMELISDPELATEDVDFILSILEGVGGIGWLFVAAFLICVILTIIGIVAIWKNKNPKLAGTMFIIAGLVSFVLSLGSILLYIAAILCFTKKEPTQTVIAEENHDNTMRPL